MWGFVMDIVELWQDILRVLSSSAANNRFTHHQGLVNKKQFQRDKSDPLAPFILLLNFPIFAKKG
jgi:hypothetical protein